MTQLKFGVLSRHILNLLLVGAAVALIAGGAAARQIDRSDKKPAPPALSNIHTRNQVQSKGSQLLQDVATEQDRADAIAAEALGLLYEQANDAHYHKGEYNHIININQVVMEGDPHNMETYSNSAYLLWSTSRKEQGVAMLKKGIAANPDTYYLYDELGQYYWLHFKDYKNALPYLEKAAKFQHAGMNTWHSLANCYEKAGQWSKAVDAWSTACLDPNDKVAIVRLKKAKAELDKQQGKTH
jgi:tetratricopeptide (TPR) repeat protein